MATDLFDYFDSVEEYEHYLQIVQSPNWQTELLLTRELQDSIKYDDPSVFKRLRIDEEDEATVERCHERYQAEQAENIDTLLRVVATAEEELRAVDRDFFDEVALRAIRRRLERVDFQKYMCEQLQRILTFLTDSGDDTSRALREFQRAVDLPSSWPPVRAAGACTPGNTNICPDFTLTDRNEDRPIWGCCAGFAKVKVFMDEDIVPANDSTPTAAPAILECADYARYHMSLRPFWNFSITLLISGTVFRVMIADRSGVIFSPARSIVDDAATSGCKPGQRDARTFVRVVRALTRHLTEYQLGQDPSVVPLSRGDLRLCLQLSSVSSSAQQQVRLERPGYYPSYRISHIGDDARQWCTVGLPIWTSLSLVGRGTVVWKVLELSGESEKGFTLKGDTHVMKSSWRDPLKIPETEVYTLIGQLEGCPRGVARPLYGGDVCYYEVLQTWSKLTVASRRRQGSDAPVQGPAPCCSSEIRRAAMEVYRRAATAVRFHSIVEAHRYLCGHGILHQDINPSNMFLWSDEAALPPYTEDRPASGILASSDMAAVDDSLLAVSSVRRITPSNEGMADDKIPDKSKIETRQFTPRSVPEIDTLQFMALELLQAVHAGRDIPHTAAHDLESIAYVLGYTVLQHLVNTPGCHIALAEAFQEHFGYMTVKGIIYQHSGIRPLKWNYLQDCGSPAEAFIADHVSLAAISDLLDDLRLKVSKIHAAYEQRKLAETRGNMYNLQSTRQLSQDEFFDHAMLLELLGSTISYLEQHPEEIKYSAIHGSM